MKLIQSNPKDASAVIIFYKKKVLLQKRDNLTSIFYPNHWGLFGGARDKLENYKATAIREVREELSYHLDKNLIKYFFKLDMQFPLPDKKKTVKRYFFLYEVKNLAYFKKTAVLLEGANMNFFSRNQSKKLLMTPYDSYALDLFFDLA